MSHARNEYADFQKLAPDACEIVSSLGKVVAVASINVRNRYGVAYRWTPPARTKVSRAALVLLRQ